ncbi:fimbrial protein [Stenotrophomonas indicatrix]|jgi:type 1 fimbria pilin|uniref:fimbrial protein n=1 Tax=Stenotrophomonas indicatrix TaxID=2045451 RepID=UPI002898DC81|nr:fimbrial protein [Stenotrophomonas indicatrix]
MCRLIQYVCLAGLFALSGSVSAQTATTTNFNVTGTILPGVCRIAVADVDLGTYQATQFTGAFNTPFQAVNVVVSQCDPLVTRVGLRFTGSADSNDATLFQGVAGIGIELQRTSTGSRLPPGGLSQMSTAAGTHVFRARFMQSAATVAAGTVSRPITVSMTYN